MVLDPVTATGVAGNVIEFIQFASSLVSKFCEIQNSAAGAALKTVEQMIIAENEIALHLNTSLRSPRTISVLTEEDQLLEDVRVHCREIALELFQALDMLKLKGTPGIRKSLKIAIGTVWREKRLDVIEKRLAKFNDLLTRQKLSAMGVEFTRFSDLQREYSDAVSLQIHTLITKQDALAEELDRQNHQRSEYTLRQYTLRQHTETRKAANSDALIIQKADRTLQKQLHEDMKYVLAEVQREIQKPRSEIGNATLQKPIVAKGSSLNHQISEPENFLSEALATEKALSDSQKHFNINKIDKLYNIDITAVQRAISPCIKSCSCICHSPRRITVPTFIVPLLGFLSITVAGLSTGYNRCNETSCLCQSILRTHISYRFPRWVVSRILRLSLGVCPVEGLVGSLKIARVVADEAEIMDFVKSGNLEGVKLLFQKRLASPNDVNFSCDVPILSYAVQGHHTDLCRFLLQSGANPCVENRLSISALDRAWRMVLTRSVHPSVANALQEIFSLWSDSIWFEEQQFLPLHKIVLGIVDRDLTSELLLSTSSINKPDAKGRTPLAWAAARGDDKAVKTLLEFGANPELSCITGNSPLLRAMSARSPVCILPLLQKGASVASKSSLKFTALHYAAYYKNDPSYLTPLLDFGAQIDQKDSYGWTALACTAERNNSKSAELLLDRGADIESRDDAGWSPLLRSVNCNSHDVLRLLLRLGASYHATSSTGESILHFAAAKGDLKTFSILAKVPLEDLDINVLNDDGKTAEEIISQRNLKSPDLVLIFYDLLKSIAGTVSKSSLKHPNAFLNLNEETFEEEIFVDTLEYQEESKPRV